MQRNIRYVGIEIGIGGLQPHTAEDVFRNRYGDCKDKATLLRAMLESVGIHSTWVLVDTRRGFVDPKIPSVDGNHAIAAIEIPAGYTNPLFNRSSPQRAASATSSSIPPTSGSPSARSRPMSRAATASSARAARASSSRCP